MKYNGAMNGPSWYLISLLHLCCNWGFECILVMIKCKIGSNINTSIAFIETGISRLSITANIKATLLSLIMYFVNIVHLMTHYLTIFNCTKLFLNGLLCCWDNRPQQQCQRNICINWEWIYWSVMLTLLSSELLSSLKQTLLYSLWYIPFP